MPRTLLKILPFAAILAALGLMLNIGISLGEAKACNADQDAAIALTNTRIDAIDDELVANRETMASFAATQEQMLEQMRTLNGSVSEINAFLREAASR